MEQTTPEQTPQAPEEQKEQQPKKITLKIPEFSLKIPVFLTEIGKDVRWYYDVRLWLPVVLVLLVLAACTGRSMGTSSAQKEYEAIIQTMKEEARIEQEREQEQLEAAVTEPTAPPIIPEAEALAILAESVGSGRSDNVKTIIMWIAINRSENAIEGHGKPLLEEIARPNQWQGYDPQKGYTQQTYDIALEVLEIRDTGGLRPLDGDMLWMVLNDNGSITVRNQFVDNGTNQWREKTIK